jgi:hypothetical protein
MISRERSCLSLRKSGERWRATALPGLVRAQLAHCIKGRPESFRRQTPIRYTHLSKIKPLTVRKKVSVAASLNSRFDGEPRAEFQNRL